MRWAFAVIGALVVVMTAQGASAQVSQEEESNRALIADRLEAWAAGTGSPYDLLAEDARWTITGNSLAAKTYPSKEAFMSEVIRPFNARMRDRLIPSVHHIYAEGDTVIAHFDARGIAHNGDAYFNSYAWILRMQDGRIVEAYAFFDAIAFDNLWKRVSAAESD
jgi:ketosteroid isomerase-like protein